jgi:hypothetical protein
VRLLAHTLTPVCVVPKLFLPISRVSVLCAPAGDDAEFALALASSPFLDQLSFRQVHPSKTAPSANAGAAAFDAHGSDLVVVSRRQLFGLCRNNATTALARRVLQSKWPVFVF